VASPTLDTSWEKLHGVVHDLATGPGRVTERLVDGWRKHAAGLAPVDGGTFDFTLYTDSAALLARMGEVVCAAADRRGSAVRALSEHEAVELADQVFDLYRRVDTMVDRGE